MNKRYKVHNHNYISPFKQRWTNPKHAKSQVVGETQQTQPLIKLDGLVRSRG
ncbi:YpzG family protein [Peribacillus tepidiphilus]|jgi:hypothetical protein|uniref:YpzG family protein n=1 Tax=Peribacillus tepidiphilus TaxID=2652445 RepID=UPI001291744A|nr:YpzG family protein [Peribacillus tepidiphilus]